MTTPEPTTVRQLIREISADESEYDPRNLAALVLAATPDHLLRDYYAETLVEYCRTTVGAARRNALADLANAENSDYTGQTHETPAPKQKQKFRPSPKVKGIRDYWAKVLAQGVNTSAGWKALGDCTIADMDFIASAHEKQAAESKARAVWARSMKEIMQEYGVETLRQVPPSDERLKIGMAA